MLTYLIRRTLSLIPVFIGLSLLIFFLIHLIPGDPAQVMSTETVDERIARLNAEYGRSNFDNRDSFLEVNRGAYSALINALMLLQTELSRVPERPEEINSVMRRAQELRGAFELIAAAREAGLVVSLGHTDATYEQAEAAIEAGATHAAHVYNAMRPFSHRETGVIGAVLTSPKVSAELIADGVHVDEAAMRMLRKRTSA